MEWACLSAVVQEVYLMAVVVEKAYSAAAVEVYFAVVLGFGVTYFVVGFEVVY